MSLDLSRGDSGVIQVAEGRGGQENIQGLGREMKEILFLEWEDYKNNRSEQSPALESEGFPDRRVCKKLSFFVGGGGVFFQETFSKEPS